MPKRPPKLFHYPGCSTCRKARKWLDANGLEVQLVDIVESPPSKKELSSVLARAEVPVRKLFNTSGQLYREGGYRDRVGSMSDVEAIAALARHGKLIKRPILLGDDVALVGFQEDAWKQALLG
jgi:Spx/MgsR family transcriptional regulator